jgi:hypothetical protein
MLFGAQQFPVSSSRDRMLAHLATLHGFTHLLPPSPSGKALAGQVAALQTSITDDGVGVAVLERAPADARGSSSAPGPLRLHEALSIGTARATVYRLQLNQAAIPPFAAGAVLARCALVAVSGNAGVEDGPLSQEWVRVARAHATAWGGSLQPGIGEGGVSPLFIHLPEWNGVEELIDHLRPSAELVMLAQLACQWRQTAALTAAVRSRYESALARFDVDATIRKRRYDHSRRVWQEQIANQRARTKSISELAVQASARLDLLRLRHDEGDLVADVVASVGERIRADAEDIGIEDLRFEHDVGTVESFTIVRAAKRFTPGPLPGFVYLSEEKYGALRVAVIQHVEGYLRGTLERFAAEMRRAVVDGVPRPARVNVEAVLGDARRRLGEPAAGLGRQPYQKKSVYGALTNARAMLGASLGVVALPFMFERLHLSLPILKSAPVMQFIGYALVTLASVMIFLSHRNGVEREAGVDRSILQRTREAAYKALVSDIERLVTSVDASMVGMIDKYGKELQYWKDNESRQLDATLPPEPSKPADVAGLLKRRISDELARLGLFRSDEDGVRQAFAKVAATVRPRK